MRKVSNQDGLGSDSYPPERFNLVQEKLLGLLASQGILFDAIHICPHREIDYCECRKPRIGLVLGYLSMPELDRSRSFVVGDRETDLKLAERMGLQGMLYDRARNNWPAIVSQIQGRMRSCTVKRKTAETFIEAAVDLDNAWPLKVDTSIGFFDHMLSQFAKHAGISLKLSASGDLQVDEHHLVEDTALVLGRALRQALGDKSGISRYGFLLPMDEALTEVALDLSGRPYLVFDGSFTREQVGGFPTELIPHFFRSFVEQLKATLHLKMRGDNAHHQIESLFKGVGRAFREAKRVDGNDIPSTKGIL